MSSRWVPFMDSKMDYFLTTTSTFICNWQHVCCVWKCLVFGLLVIVSCLLEDQHLHQRFGFFYPNVRNFHHNVYHLTLQKERKRKVIIPRKKRVLFLSSLSVASSENYVNSARDAALAYNYRWVQRNFSKKS